MNRLLFFSFTLSLALCQFRLPPGGPHLLLGWLVAIAFYGERPRDIFWAFWIGAVHSFPLSSPNPWSIVFILLSFQVLRKQRYFLGCDHVLPRVLSISILVIGLDLIDWWQLKPQRPGWEEIYEILFTHAAFTVLMGLPLLSFARRFKDLLGLRQTRWDF